MRIADPTLPRGATSSRPTLVVGAAALVLNLVSFAPATEAAAEPVRPPADRAATVSPPVEELLHYEWRTQGFFGVVAGLFFPSHGVGTLSRRATPEGNLESELWIGTGRDDDPNFFRYGAEISGANGATVRAWSSQLWRGKRKDKQSRTIDPGMIDVASAIQRLRRDRPGGNQRVEIWSDGKVYPVEIRPLGRETIEVGEAKQAAFHVAVRPLEEPDRRVWKGELDLWFAEDTAATPVRMLVSRPPARVLLELVPAP